MKDLHVPVHSRSFFSKIGVVPARQTNTIFSWDFCRSGISAWSAMIKIFEGDGADWAGVIGLIRQGFARVGLEADQPDRGRVSSDRGFLIGRSGCDRSDQGQLSLQKLVGEFFFVFWQGKLAGILWDVFGPTKHQPNGPAEGQFEFFGPISGLNFGR